MTAEEFISEWNNGLPYIVAHTSGSTGKPKRIILDKSLVADSAARTIRFFRLGPASTLLLPLSPDYIAGKMMIVRALLSGARLIVQSPSNDVRIPHETVDLLAVVPSQLDVLLENEESLGKVRNIIVGGSPLSPALTKRAAHSGINIFETYGMTETASHIALRRVGDPFFTPLENISVSLSSSSTLLITLPLPSDQIPYKSSGNTSRFLTNDLAELTPDGRFRIIGRADDAIITGALKVHPALLEQKLSPLVSEAIPGASFAVTSRPHPKWLNEIVLLLHLPFQGNNDLEDPEVLTLLKDLKPAIKRILPPHERPRAVGFIDNWPLTDSGKLKRAVLRQFAASHKLFVL